MPADAVTDPVREGGRKAQLEEGHPVVEIEDADPAGLRSARVALVHPHRVDRLGQLTCVRLRPTRRLLDGEIEDRLLPCLAHIVVVDSDADIEHHRDVPLGDPRLLQCHHRGRQLRHERVGVVQFLLRGEVVHVRRESDLGGQ
nr:MULTISPECIES: hypothetical protein [Microbacterium]